MLCYLAYPTSPTLQAANALQTYTTLRELRRRQPDLLALVPRWNSEKSRFAELGAIQLPRPALGRFSRLHRSALWYYAEYSLFAWMCAPIIAKQQVSAIYIRQIHCAAWWSGVLGPRLGIPVIYEAHDLESRNPSRAKEQWAQGLPHLLDKIALTRSSAVVSLTNEFRCFLEKIAWRSPNEVFVIPDAYDETLFKPQNRLIARKQLSLPNEAQLIVYAGMTFTHRWLDGLLEAISRIPAKYSQLLLVLVGGRPQEREDLREKAQKLRVSEKVILVGARPQAEIVQYLAAADVLVIPDTVTDLTASPLKLFEYLAMGPALVLPELPALKEIVAPNLAHYFPRRDLSGLVQALNAALENKDDKLGQEARRALAQDHTYGKRADRILALADLIGLH